MRTHRLLLAVVALGTAPLAAQGSPAARPQAAPPAVRQFLPKDYNNSGQLDVRRLLDGRLFAAIERSFAGIALRRFEDEFGFAFEELDLVRWAMRTDHPSPQEAATDTWPRMETASTWVLRGTPEVDVGGRRDVDPEMFGRLRGYRDGERVWLQLDEGVVVACEADRANATLRGEAHGGVPVPELLALTAGRPPLAIMAKVLEPGHVLERWGMEPIPDDWLDFEDPPRGISVRVDEDDAGLQVVGRLRFGSDGPAREHFQRRLEEQLVAWREDAALRSIHGVLEQVGIRGDRQDVVAELHLDPDGGEVMRLVQFVLLTTVGGAARQPQPQVDGAPVVVPRQVETIEEPGEAQPEGGGKKEQQGGTGRG